MTTCLIKQSACGRAADKPVCPKCGLDERVVYPGQADREAAQERAELQYWRTHSHALEARVATPQASSSRPEFAAPCTKVIGQVFRDAPWAPEMAVLPSGKFLMGSPESEQGRSADESPQHEVTIGYKLAMGKYPVTFEEWDACVADGGTDYIPEDNGWGRGKHPVINVSWDDVQQYVAWLNKKLGIAESDPARYRLPSEAEWEYACRAGTSTEYWWGGTFQPERCLGNLSLFREFRIVFGKGAGMPAVDSWGPLTMNPWGLHGMLGYVFEWVLDEYGPYSSAPSKVGHATSNRVRGILPEVHQADFPRSLIRTFVLRGGAWNIDTSGLRAASRFKNHARHRSGQNQGFRLTRIVP